MIKKTITVFTPTYNRAYCLSKCYESLRRQTVKAFIWLIIDDGSTDDTRELVDTWKKKPNGFAIEYVYKKNEGLYSGYTTAFDHIQTELCVCVDSDDYLTDAAIEMILACWKERGGPKYAGILGLDCTENGTIIGDPLPNQNAINLIDIAIGKYAFKNGDRKDIVRTELYKQAVPFASIPGEKDFNPHYLHLEISRTYDFLVLNEKLCVVNYQPDGMTATVFVQYYRSPKSYRIMRQQELSFPNAPFLFYVKKTIHYVSSCILSRSPCIKGTPRKLLAIVLYPLGILLTVFVRLKNLRGHRS